MNKMRPVHPGEILREELVCTQGFVWRKRHLEHLQPRRDCPVRL